MYSTSTFTSNVDLDLKEILKKDKDRLQCIFFSEFDNIQGPKITYQIPEGFDINFIFPLMELIGT